MKFVNNKSDVLSETLVREINKVGDVVNWNNQIMQDFMNMKKNDARIHKQFDNNRQEKLDRNKEEIINNINECKELL
jgi:predicted phage gp36 major capsid-like protein